MQLLALEKMFFVCVLEGLEKSARKYLHLCVTIFFENAT